MLETIKNKVIVDVKTGNVFSSNDTTFPDLIVFEFSDGSKVEFRPLTWEWGDKYGIKITVDES